MFTLKSGALNAGTCGDISISSIILICSTFHRQVTKCFTNYTELELKVNIKLKESTGVIYLIIVQSKFTKINK